MNSQRKERVSMDLNQEVIELLDALKVEVMLSTCLLRICSGLMGKKTFDLC